MARGKTPILELRHLVRTFTQGGTELRILKDANLTVWPGEIVGLVGPSGSGKSTLLHIAGLLERPDEGQVFVDGRECMTMKDSQRTKIRRDDIGFVYQAHHLLPEFTALENVVMPQIIASRGRHKAREEAKRLLVLMGLSGRLEHQPMQLSGGEQQRVAVARSLANQPKVLLADEPTGNLDPRTSESVFEALLTLVRGEGLAGVIATHNFALAERMDRVVRLEDGKLYGGLPEEAEEGKSKS